MKTSITIWLKKCSTVDGRFEPQYSKPPLAPHNASRAARPRCDAPKVTAIVQVITTRMRSTSESRGPISAGWRQSRSYGSAGSNQNARYTLESCRADTPCSKIQELGDGRKQGFRNVSRASVRDRYTRCR